MIKFSLISEYLFTDSSIQSINGLCVTPTILFRNLVVHLSGKWKSSHSGFMVAAQFFIPYVSLSLDWTNCGEHHSRLLSFKAWSVFFSFSLCWALTVSPFLPEQLLPQKQTSTVQFSPTHKPGWDGPTWARLRKVKLGLFSTMLSCSGHLFLQ